MHKISEKEFTLEDFSYEHLDIRTHKILEETIKVLNDYRNIYINYNPDDFEIKGCPSKKDIWWQMIQLLPSSYNQTRNVMLNYEVLANIYKSRKDHKLDEWREFCKWIESLPYSELIVSTSSGCKNKVNKSEVRWAEDIFKNHGIKLTEAQIDAINSIGTTNNNNYDNTILNGEK